jgi:chemotaxis signal transduction protein
MSSEAKFLLFPAAGRNCAIAAERVAELAPPALVHVFPHGTAEIGGVILRHGRVVPLYQLDRLLPVVADGSVSAPESEAGDLVQYQVIVVRQVAGAYEQAAFAVNGACDLVTAELLPANSDSPVVIGELEWGGKTYTALNIDQLLAAESEA